MKKSNFNKALLLLPLLVIGLIILLVVLSANEGSRLVYIGNSRMEEILNDMSGEGNFVYVGSPSCPACNTLRPVVEGVLESLGEELLYFETDRAREDDPDKRRELFDRMGITGTPTIAYIESGVVIDVLVGVQSQETLLEFFNAYDGFK